LIGVNNFAIHTVILYFTALMDEPTLDQFYIACGHLGGSGGGGNDGSDEGRRRRRAGLAVVSRLDMYGTNVLMYRTMVLLAHPTKVRH
jgi:hypothetical protein